MDPVNFSVLTCYLSVLGVIVWHFRKSSRRPADYFLGGRRFGAWPVGLSVMVTGFSAVNYLAFPGEVHGYGLYVLASLPAFFLAAWPVVRYWIPFFRRHAGVSVYTFLETRYDARVRLGASAIFLLWRLLWMSTALYASCRIMEALTGLSFGAALLLGGCVAAGYSSFGGMKAVIWSDVLQFFVLLGSILAAVLFACGGENFASLLPGSGALRPFLPPDGKFLSPDPSLRITLWSALIGSTVVFLTRFGADQMVMQRYLAARDAAAAGRGLWINGIASTLALSLLALFGMALRIFVQKQGLPADTPPLKAMALLLGSFPPGVPGLVGAGLLAATMSSMDSGLNSCAAAIRADFLPRLGRRARKISPRTMTFALSLPVMAAAFWLLPALNRDATLFVILNKIVNVFGTPLLAVMISALFFRKIGTPAVFCGMISGLLFSCIFAGTVSSLALHYYALAAFGGTLGLIALFQLFFSLWRCFRRLLF